MKRFNEANPAFLRKSHRPQPFAHTAGDVAERVAQEAAKAGVIDIAGTAPHQWCVSALRTRVVASTAAGHVSSSDSGDDLMQARTVSTSLWYRL